MDSLSPDPLELDVRPLFASGMPPLGAILDAVDRLKPGQSLLLIAPIEPVPLYSVLGQRGFAASPRVRDDGAWEILFRSSGR